MCAYPISPLPVGTCLARIEVLVAGYCRGFKGRGAGQLQRLYVAASRAPPAESFGEARVKVVALHLSVNIAVTVVASSPLLKGRIFGTRPSYGTNSGGQGAVGGLPQPSSVLVVVRNI